MLLPYKQSLFVCVLLLAIMHTKGLAETLPSMEEAKDILDIGRGVVVLGHTGQGLAGCPEDYCYPVIATLDGTVDEYWMSPINRPYPHRWVIELDRTYQVESLVIDNTGAEEKRYPGVSTREVTFYGSTVSPSEGYTELVRMEGKRDGRQEIEVPKPRPVRWLKVEIVSNFDHERHTELMELEAYGPVVGLLPDQPDASGVYRSNYGMMKLEVDGNKVRGCYIDNGHFWGVTDGRVFLLNWAHEEAEYFGTAVMVMASSGNYISGMWYEDIFKGVWFGNRVADNVDPECEIDPNYPGEGVQFERKKPKRHPLPTMQLKSR